MRELYLTIVIIKEILLGLLVIGVILGVIALPFYFAYGFLGLSGGLQGGFALLSAVLIFVGIASG